MYMTLYYLKKTRVNIGVGKKVLYYVILTYTKELHQARAKGEPDLSLHEIWYMQTQCDVYVIAANTWAA